jgi:hypothetical protein
VRTTGAPGAAWHFARGKLKGDPVFRAILERDCSRTAHGF